MKKYLLITLASLLLVSPVSAATYGAGDQYILSTGQSSHGNLYAAGTTVTLNGNSEADAIVAGSDVSIYGPVGQDLAAAGGSVNVAADIGDDARIAGGTVIISKHVKGDVLVMGGQVTLTPTAVVDGEVLVMGGSVRLDGDFRGLVQVDAGTVALGGRFAKAVIINARQQVNVDPSAQILNLIAYRAAKQADFPSSVGPNQIKYLGRAAVTAPALENRLRAGQSFAFGSILIIWILLKLLSFLLIAWLTISYSKKLVPAVVDQASKRPWSELGRGFAIFFLLPIALCILCMTVIGILPAVIIGLAYGLTLIFAHVVAGILLGYWLQKLFTKTKSTVLSMGWTTLGIIIYVLLLLIPIIGWLAGFGIFLISLGSLSIVSFNKHKTII